MNKGPMPDQRPEWQALLRKAQTLADTRIDELFAREPERVERMSLRVDELYLDYSKQLLDGEAMDTLFALLAASDFTGWRRRLFAGEAINHTENRAVLHMALRDRSVREWQAAGEPVREEVAAVRERILAFADSVRRVALTGATGQRLRDVVAIGIGGSHLGPALVCDALGSASGDGPRVHFVSNVDGSELERVLANCQPASTLFVVISKTFTTLETMTNAHSARRWLVAALGEAATRSHFAAVSTNVEAAVAFGIEAHNVFGFWDWVGGRFSLWSAVGLPIALALGRSAFEAMLDGAAAMDAHFESAPVEENLPVLLALIEIWQVNFCGHAARAVIPYDARLRLLPAFLQQLEMESNGKRVDRDGRGIAYATAPVVWGACGTDAQHAFFQALHQGTQIVPVDFLVCARADHPWAEHHEALTANCLAQSEALMVGRSAETARAQLASARLPADVIAARLPYVSFPGNRPSSTVVLDALTPATLGAWIAACEHKVFVESVIWNINAFDQWGVELGKQLAGSIQSASRSPGGLASRDASTRTLAECLQARSRVADTD